MHALKGLSQLGIGSPTNKDIKGKKLTPSGGVRVTGPGESGNGGTVGLRDKFPQEMDKCLRACRSHDKIRNVTEESKLGNRSSSWVRLGSPIPGEKCRNSCNKSNEKRLAINKLRGGRLAQKRNSQAETGHLLSPKRNPKLQLKTSLLKTQTPAIPDTSFLKSPKKSLVGISELQQTKLLKGSDQKKIKGQVEVGDRKKKKQSLHKLHEQLQNMNSETDGLKLQPKPKKNLKEYILNFAPPNEDSQLKRNKSLKKAIDHDFKRTRVGAPECLSGDEDIASLVQKISQSKIKMPKVTFKPMLMPAKDLNQVGSLQRAKSPGTKSKKTLSVHIPEIPESLKQKITDLMSKKKSIDQGPKPAKKTKSKFVSKKIPKTPSNDLVSQLVDPSRAKSPKQILRNQKKKKVQKKLMGAKPLEEIEFEGRIYTLKENSKATTKKQRESGSHQYIDIDLNNDSDRLKPRHSMSSDEEGTPHSKGVIIRTPTVGSNLNGHSASHSGLKNLVGFQSHVELDDIVGAQSAIAELEAEQNAIVEQPVRIPAYNNQKEIIDEPAKVVPTDHPSGSQSRRKSKGSSSEKKNLIINTGSKAFDQAEVDSIVVIEQSDDGQVKKVDEGVQVSLETFRRSEKDVLRMKSDISIIKKEDDPFHQNFKLEDLAKEEYKKWSQVNSMLKDIEEKIGAKAATEIKELFSRLDTFANQSKKNLKEAFLASDMCMSNQLSERKPKVNEEMNGGFSREQRFGAVFNPNDTHDDSSRNNSFHPSVILSYQPQASSKKTKTYKKNEMEVWPDGMLPHSSSATPNSMNHKQILLPSFHKNDMSHHRDGLYAGNDVLVYSERLKSSKGDHLLPLTDTQIKLVKSTNDSGSKIKVIDNFETKFEQNNQAGESLVKSAFLPQQSDLAPTSQAPSDQQSLLQDQSSTRKMPDLAISEGSVVPVQIETPILENKNTFNIPNHLECSPISITDDQTSSFGSPGSPDLKKYIENPANDLNWLMMDKVAKRDNSFEEEVKTCRKQFLIETMTDFILNELISELKAEHIYFRKLPKREEPRINVQLLDDPRYVTESSDEETIYGIRTNMNAVYEYCNLLVRFILDNYLDLLLEKFNHKKVKNPKEVLENIREREVLLALPGNQWKEIAKLKDFCRPKEYYFPEFIFESLEQEIISNYNNMNIMQNLFDMQKVYHKSIFDCINEIITERWLADADFDAYKVVVHNKEYKSKLLLTLAQLEDLIVASKDTAVEYSTMMCGVIRDKEDSLLGNLKSMPADRIELIREDRLFRFLCFEAIDMERTFVNYTLDEVFTLLDCSDAIFDTLVSEVVEDLASIRK